MKKGIHYWALPIEMSLQEKMAFAKKCGFDGVELVVTKNGELKERASSAELAEIQKMAINEGVEILSLTNALNWNCSFTSEKKSVRQKALDTLKRQIDIAAALGVDSILALPGFVSLTFPVNDLHPAQDTNDDEAYHPSMEKIPYDRAYERSVEGMKSAAEYAEQSGVTLCVENIWSNFLLSPLEMKKYLEDVDSSFVRSYFDAGNVCPYGIPQHWIRILGEKIGRIHIKDYVQGKLTLDSFVEIGKGSLDFKEIASAVKDIGYDGWITAELNVDVADPERVARETARIMDDLFFV